MNRGLPTSSLIPPNGDPDVVQTYMSERYATEARVSSSKSAAPAATTSFVIPYIFPFNPDKMRVDTIKQSLRERLILVANSYPENALQITGISFSAKSNFWAPAAINVAIVTKMPGEAAPSVRILNRKTAFVDRMVTAVVPPNGNVDVDILAAPTHDIVSPYAERAPCATARGISGMAGVVYPDHDVRITGVTCRMVPKNSHLGAFLKNESVSQPREKPEAYMSKMCADSSGDVYLVYSEVFGALFKGMLEKEARHLYLDDVANGVHDFELNIMPQVAPLGAEPVEADKISAENPLIAVSLINTSNPDEEIGDRWRNTYTVQVDFVFEFVAHKRNINI
jgi:hypothetical protein